MKRFTSLLFAATLALAGCVHVEHHKENGPVTEHAPGETSPADRAWCTDHPHQCEGWCTDHPGQCTAKHSWCNEHPGECEGWCRDHADRCTY